MTKWFDRSNLIQGNFAGFAALSGQSDRDAKGVARSIADVARDKVGSRDYLTSKASGNYPAGSNKCNKLVCDVVGESGRPRPQVHYAKEGFLGWLKSLFTRDPSANEIANPRVDIPGWSGPRPLSEARVSDIIAQQHGMYGHSGIVERFGSTISVNTRIGGIVERNDWGFRDPPLNGEWIGDPAPVVRHYNGY